MTHIYRKGDIVTVHATIADDEYQGDDKVWGDGGPKVRLELVGHYEKLFVPKTSVQLVTPHFNVGDRVGFKLENEEPSPQGKVKAVVDGYVWVKLDNEAMQTFPAKDTVLLDNEQVTS
ncbi:hypothetical protein ASE36_00420 [Rhizobium sp. Root274]|uniref:hypothetical protein n=1 Tax=unclassified Rhizobium TaxID=2613769 RepID=UPI00071548A5|nr:MULTISPECIES: hypothetical protein [unclassified Rhizobium]KQW30803.1 hypothetical protein ASC71_00420 [Rhizobium sp. Root1240]KRD32350.1 hypothetical protein ASE36_00420 [Rhizobium sp. Root274]